MTDYTKAINGSVGGEMMIRDSGGVVSFWIKSGNADSWDGDLGWTGTVNGVTVGGSFYYGLPGGVWRQIGAWTVSYSQTIYFGKTTDSGSMGLGGPTNFWVAISRAGVPPAPTMLAMSLITHETMRVQFNGNGDGGSPILEWQFSFGTNGGAIEGAGNSKYSSSGTSTVSGLKPGQYYAAWARGRNALGWGPWSSGKSAYTLAGCHVRVGGVWKSAVPYVKVAGVWKPAIPYVRVAGVWKMTTN